jgi:hypothetical protein
VIKKIHHLQNPSGKLELDTRAKKWSKKRATEKEDRGWRASLSAPWSSGHITAKAAPEKRFASAGGGLIFAT